MIVASTFEQFCPRPHYRAMFIDTRYFNLPIIDATVKMNYQNNHLLSLFWIKCAWIEIWGLFELNPAISIFTALYRLDKILCFWWFLSPLLNWVWFSISYLLLSIYSFYMTQIKLIKRIWYTVYHIRYMIYHMTHMVWGSWLYNCLWTTIWFAIAFLTIRCFLFE